MPQLSSERNSKMGGERVGLGSGIEGLYGRQSDGEYFVGADV